MGGQYRALSQSATKTTVRARNLSDLLLRFIIINSSASGLCSIFLCFKIVGNLLFRLLHNVIFAAFTPRIRVVISLVSMSFSMAILICSYWMFRSTSVIVVYVAYLIGGIGIGSFESNILATITPLGHDTKLWAMMGISVGFFLITVGGYAFMAITGLDVLYIYITVGIACFLSIFLWLFRIPIPTSYRETGQSFSQFMGHLRSWREWLPAVKWHCIALLVDMFCLSYNTAINQYIYDGQQFPLFGVIAPRFMIIDQNVFLMLLNLFQFIGDISGRKIIYYFKLNTKPCYFLVLSVLGLMGCMSKVPVIALISTMLVMLANGLIYSSSTYFMDNQLVGGDRKYLLTSLSVWLFIGDIGSVVGSNVWESIVPVVCDLIPSSHEYFCASK